MSLPGFTVILLFLLFAPTIVSSPLLAQADKPPQRIEEIRIIGNRRIPESTIRYYLQSKEEDAYNEDQILRDYRSLLNTNFFEDAAAKYVEGETGIIVIFEVVERPLIRALEYEGMKSFKESDVLERFRDMRVGLTVDSPFDASKLPKARRAIQMLLDQNGRPLGRVEAETERITSSSVKLIFTIDEGPKVRIGDIRFEGNTVFDDGELRKALELTRERGPVTQFKGLDKYIKEKLEYDLQVNLLEAYRERGYMFAKAGEPKVEIVEASRGWLFGFRKTKQQYYVTIPIQEGEQYRYGSFDIEGVESLDAEQVKKFYNIIPGEVVNYVALKKANDELKKAYSTSGYLDVTVIPQMDPDQEKKTVNINVQVEEGKQYIVNRINFAGNTKTRDKVLRREFFLEEQDRFNGNLLDISVLRLNQLGFFEKVEEKDYEVIKRPNEGEVDILVKVKERSQQSIGLTGGVSGIYGSFFGINYQSNNFRGLGQQIDVNILTGSRTANFMFSFNEPYFMDTKLSTGFSVFNQRFRFDTFTAFFGLISPSQNVQLFTRHSTGFTIRGGYPLWRWTRVGLSYSLSTIKITDIDDLFRDFALNQLVGFTPGGSAEDARKGIIRSEVTPSLVYNTKNQFFGATGGSQFTVQVPISGGPLGGTFNIIQPFVEYQKFISDKWISGGRNTLAFRAQFMHVLPYGKLPGGGPMSVPFFERVFWGGEFNLRGFDIRSVTPWAITRTASLDNEGNPIIDPATGLPSISESVIPVGGDTAAILTLEYRMPIVGPLQLTGFFDFGTSTVLKKSNLLLFGPNTFIDLQEQTNNVWRASTGAEVQFLMPMVNQPFRLIFAYNPFILDSSIVMRGVRFPLKEPQKNIRFTVGYTF
ncbi:MAG: outer membrane protein assembly factor BamA [Acidobacteriota bacterium]